MPNGLPNSSALNSRKACAFALDTSVVEAAGFRFNDGPLRHLAGQLPPWFQLWMPDIVLREISQHRTALEDLIKNMELGDSPIEVVVGRDKLGPDWMGEPVKESPQRLFTEIGDDIPF